MSLPKSAETLSRKDPSGLLATGGLIAGILASSCCLLPLALVSLGISGAWIGRLTSLSPFQPIFLTAGTVALGFAFWWVYLRKPEICAPGSLCEVPQSRIITKTLLWCGAGLVVAALTIDFLPQIG